MRPISTSEGLQIAVHDFGGDGPKPILLAHGTGFHGQIWRPLVEGVKASEFHCYSFDARGHGDTAPPQDRDFDWHQLARDVLAVVRGLELVRPFGVGHSSGATSLLLAEELQPGTFQMLYCFEPVVVPADPPLGRDPNNWLAAQARRRREVFSSREEAHEHYASKPLFGKVVPEALRAYVDHGMEEVDGTVRLKCRPEDEALVYEMATANDCFARLHEVSCPVMLASGEGTEAFRDGMVNSIAARLPKHRTEILPGVGHLGPMEAPRAVAESVLTFFRSA